MCIRDRFSLGSAANISVAELAAAWSIHSTPLSDLSKKFGKQIVFTNIGYQSRPDCHITPWSTPRKDGKDCSCWKECYDMNCQANAYEAALQVFAGESYCKGFYWSLWKSDPTAGGPSDSTFSPQGKPAEGVLRRYYGNMSIGWEESMMVISRRISDLNKMYRSQSPKTVGALYPNATNGFVFGSGEWSYPGFRLDSTAARQSLRNAKDIGANSIEIVVMWYFDTIHSTRIYPITDYAQPLRTASDSELESIIDYAKNTLGLEVLFSPMLDPNFDLPGNCRQCPHTGWRGLIGESWPETCEDGSLWADWFGEYEQFLLRYAHASKRWGADAFLVSHELYNSNAHCSDRWAALVQKVKKIYPGTDNVGAVVENSIALNHGADWIGGLDYFGVDCYNGLDVHHDPLPWKNPSEDVIQTAWTDYLEGLKALSGKYGGKKIRCTEMGYQSRPWVYSKIGTDTPVGHQLDPHDCSVFDQCIDLDAQKVAYDALLSAFYPQPFFKGFYLSLIHI
eukprot:TRINITY_DN9990_c0_g1_i2.p1 TRINITY_DN9990_c0_g1~~TRINITY_DN9990_c0_g1_i2.p1  ORF type:complete len:508 (+),score=36.62 TRINITY_DN9990_c0_g1_i2:51-1574(+)